MFMRMIIYALGAAFIISGCTPGGLAASGPITEVEIDGVPTLVRKMRVDGYSYAANPRDISGGWIDPSDYVRNVKAIEAVTGCKVLPVSIQNAGLQTIATVECDG